MSSQNDNGSNQESKSENLIVLQEEVTRDIQTFRETNIWPDDIMMKAAKAGSLDLFKQIHELGSGVNVTDCQVRVHGLELRLNVNICHILSYYGYLDCLQYAYEHGAKMDIHSTRYAAMNGNVQCLQYLLDRGCPIDEDASRVAIKYGELECVQYLVECGHPVIKQACVVACEFGRLNILVYLIKKQFPVTYTMYEAAIDHAFRLCCRYYDTPPSFMVRAQCLLYLLEHHHLSQDDLETLLQTRFGSARFQEICQRYPEDQDAFYTLFNYRVWRESFFSVDFSKSPFVESFISRKKEELQLLTDHTSFLVDENLLPRDIVKYNIMTYY